MERKPRNADFFRHTACEYFPCHATEDPETFNCLFCYCPLYALGPDCGGQYRYTAKGVKNCAACLLPHTPAGRAHILAKFPQLAELAREKGE